MALICDDVGTTARRKMTRSRALRAWERGRGVCVLCELPIDGAREDWFVEHIRALELGGADEDENLGPAHYACKPAKDAEDHGRAARAKRQKARYLGIRTSDHPLPCGRNSPFKKTMDGRVVRRDGSE